MSSSLAQRILTAVVGLPIILAAIWLGGTWLLLIVLAATAIAGWEFYRLAGSATNSPPLVWLGILFVVAVVANAEFQLVAVEGLVAAVAVAPLIYLIIRRSEDPLISWAATVAGFLYVGFLTSHAVLLRNVDDGRDWLVFALLVTFATDTGAYAVGRLVGRHKMAPSISPNKTWEGAIGGVLGAVLAAWGLSVVFELPLAVWQAIALGGAVSIAGQLGDLSESMLKRRAGADESSHILPGHGGILDRLDSVVFTIPLVYYFVTGGGI